MGRPKGSKNKSKTPPPDAQQSAPPEQPTPTKEDMESFKQNMKDILPPTEPKSPRLPGMENAGIPELEHIAEALNNVRSQRIALSKQEGELSDDLLAMMKRYGKVEYHHEDVHAWREVTEEKVKVTIGELSPEKEKKIKAAVKAHIETPKVEAGDENQAGNPSPADTAAPEVADADLPDDLEDFEEEFEDEEDAELPAGV